MSDAKHGDCDLPADLAILPPYQRYQSFIGIYGGFREHKMYFSAAICADEFVVRLHIAFYCLIVLLSFATPNQSGLSHNDLQEDYTFIASEFHVCCNILANSRHMAFAIDCCLLIVHTIHTSQFGTVERRCQSDWYLGDTKCTAQCFAIFSPQIDDRFMIVSEKTFRPIT